MSEPILNIKEIYRERPWSVKLGCFLQIVYMVISSLYIWNTTARLNKADILVALIASGLVLLAMVWLIFRGSNAIRIIFLVFAIINTGLAVAAGLIFSHHLLLENPRHLFEFAFNLTTLFSIFFMFTPSANRWYKQIKVAKSIKQ